MFDVSLYQDGRKAHLGKRITIFKAYKGTPIYVRYVEYKSVLALSNAKLLERSHPIYPRVLKESKDAIRYTSRVLDEPTQPIYIPRGYGKSQLS